MQPAQQNTLLKIIKPPWEECPACGVKMDKIKYAPVDVDEAEGQKRAGRITGLPFCEKGCAQLGCFSCGMKLFTAAFCVRIESRSGLRK